MILSFDDRDDIHLWHPISGGYMRIDTGIPTNPARQVLTRGSTGMAITWPVMAVTRIRDESVPIGKEGAFKEVPADPAAVDSWLLECCKAAAVHFGARKAVQHDIEYVRQ